MVLRIFEPKRSEIMGEWRKLKNEQLHDLYISPNTIMVIKSRSWMQLVGHIAHMGEMRNTVLVGRLEGKKSLGIPRHRQEDNIKMNLAEIGWEGMDWIHLAQDKDQWWVHVNMVMNLWGPEKVGGGEFLIS
jgi:hypothetical protein